MSKQLNPHSHQDFICDNCQKKFQNETAYSPQLDSGFLTETYCLNCIETTKQKPETCSFKEIDHKTNQYIACDKPLFDKKKKLCRSHNRQLWKKFNEFTRDMSISSTAGWLVAWNQSGDWKYWWNLETKAPASNQATTNNHWNKIQKKSLGEVPQAASQNLQAPETAPSDKRISGRTKQLNLKVKEQTYWKLKELALKDKCLMTEILEKSLACYEEHHKK